MKHLFYIIEGSAKIEAIADVIKELCKNLKDWPKETQLIIVVGIFIIFAMYFIYQIIKNNNNTKIKLSNNELEIIKHLQK